LEELKNDLRELRSLKAKDREQIRMENVAKEATFPKAKE
jgi:hypothetical protein